MRALIVDNWLSISPYNEKLFGGKLCSAEIIKELFGVIRGLNVSCVLFLYTVLLRLKLGGIL